MKKTAKAKTAVVEVKGKILGLPGTSDLLFTELKFYTIFSNMTG